MLRSAASKVMWVGRATVFLVGLAVILALIFGVASAALGADGDFFKVGRSNLAASVSKLIKSGAGPALELHVDSGAPLKVNSAAKVAKLNADKLDGKDSTAFVPTDTYVSTLRLDAPTTPGTTSQWGRANCNQGPRDLVISGGVVLDPSLNSTDTIYESQPQADPAFQQGWSVAWRTNTTSNVKGGTVYALCARMP